MDFAKNLMTISLCLSPLLVYTQETESQESVAINLFSSSPMHYPQTAIDARIEGIIVLEVMIDTLCHIQNKRVLGGLGYGLDEVALNMIDQKFESSLVRELNKCSSDTMLIPVRFKLK